MVPEDLFGQGSVLVKRGKGHKNGIGRSSVLDGFLHIAGDEGDLLASVHGGEEAYVLSERGRRGSFPGSLIKGPVSEQDPGQKTIVRVCLTGIMAGR